MKNINFADGVKKTPAIVRSAELLDAYFDGEPSWITSGLRLPSDQIEIIIQKLKRHNLYNDFPELGTFDGFDLEHKFEHEGEYIYWWQRGWSRLLNVSDIVNPPYPAIVLYDYFRPGSQENKKGKLIDISPHQRGIAFDIGGGERLLDKAKCVMRANQENKCFITDYLVERVNNAIHIGCRQIG